MPKKITEEKVTAAAKKEPVKKRKPRKKTLKQLTKQAIENRIDRILIALLGAVVIALVTIIITFLFLEKSERQQWYQSHYYVYSKVESRTVMTTEERKQRFQMKIIGFMKDTGTNMTDEEMINLTQIVFDKSEEYGWDPYLAIAVAWKESRFNKYAFGDYDDSGLFQFLPSTAYMVSSLAGLQYYRNIEFNPVDAAKLWFAYMKALVDMFNGDLSCALLAYNMGDRQLIRLADMKVNKKTGRINTENANLIQAKNNTYYKKGRKPYDEEVIKLMEYLRTKGSREDLLKTKPQEEIKK